MACFILTTPGGAAVEPQSPKAESEEAQGAGEMQGHESNGWI